MNTLYVVFARVVSLGDRERIVDALEQLLDYDLTHQMSMNSVDRIQVGVDVLNEALTNREHVHGLGRTRLKKPSLDVDHEDSDEMGGMGEVKVLEAEPLHSEACQNSTLGKTVPRARRFQHHRCLQQHSWEHENWHDRSTEDRVRHHGLPHLHAMAPGPIRHRTSHDCVELLELD